MLSLLKKDRTAPEKSSAKAWRVDFRNPANLPDIKTVRTGFAVNASVFVVVGSIFIFGLHREITVSNLQNQIENIDSRIAVQKTASEKAVNLYKEYQTEEKIVKEALAFGAVPFDYVAFVCRFAEVIPVGTKANRIDYRGMDQPLIISGEIAGIDANASATADALITKLQQDEKIKNLYRKVSLSKLTRNGSAETLSFELLFDLK